MIHLHCPAKVNLSLAIVGKREDGYHLLDSLIAPIDWYDQLKIKPASTLRLWCNGGENFLPVGEDNLILRAARALAKHAGIKRPGASIYLTKNLPIGAGLGGGSSNAASCLLGLNQLWGLGLNKTTLHSIALTLGADVPFFIFPQPARVQGIGECITPVDIQPRTLLLLLPKIHCDTRRVYTTYAQISGKSNGQNALAQLTSDRGKVLFTAMPEAGNDLTSAVLTAYPQLHSLIASLPDPTNWQFSGTGSCLFRCCTCVDEAYSLAEKIAVSVVDAKKAYTRVATTLATTKCERAARH